MVKRKGIAEKHGSKQRKRKERDLIQKILAAAQEAGGEEDPGDDEEDYDFDDVDEELMMNAEHLGDHYLLNFQPTVIEDTTCDKRAAGEGVSVATSSRDEGSAQRFVEWLLSPMSLERFFLRFWERRPLVIQRPKNRSYYDGWFSKDDIDSLLRSSSLMYGTNVDVTKYEAGERTTLNGEGVASAEDVWRMYGQGCSVRVLHPQRWSNHLWLMLSTLERHFGTIVGANAYLTPAGSQGFSPHFDDIDAFVLQVEGKKQWRLYAPRGAEEALPRFSSNNFSQDEIGEAILDVVLEAGDILYMPRGTIHQAVTPSDEHSLHVTISANQRHTWADFLDLSIPRALEMAAEESVLLRQSLPRDYGSYVGVVHSDSKKDPRREAFLDRLMHCCYLVFNSLPWDPAADRLNVSFLRDRLPLFPEGAAGEALLEARLEMGTTESRRGRRAGQNGSASHDGAEGNAGEGSAAAAHAQGELSNGNDTGTPKNPGIVFATQVRLAAPGIARLVVEEDVAVVYHMLCNSRTLHNHGNDTEQPEASEGEGNLGAGEGKEPAKPSNRLEFPVDFGPALEQLLSAYPDPIPVSSLALDAKKDSLRITKQLVSIGVLVVV